MIERLAMTSKQVPAEATAEIKRFLAETSCNNAGVMAEMSSAHRLNKCLTVEELRWVELGRDVLGFEVVLRSDDSLEALAKRYSAVRQPEGGWRFEQRN